jgi:hypothetical protein
MIGCSDKTPKHISRTEGNVPEQTIVATFRKAPDNKHSSDHHVASSIPLLDCSFKLLCATISDHSIIAAANTSERRKKSVWISGTKKLYKWTHILYQILFQSSEKYEIPGTAQNLRSTSAAVERLLRKGGEGRGKDGVQVWENEDGIREEQAIIDHDSGRSAHGDAANNLGFLAWQHACHENTKRVF